MYTIVPTLFDATLSDIGFPPHTVPAQLADQLFTFFEQHPLFDWKNSNNGCEGRADAVCLMLEEWDIPCYKAWVFSGAYLKNHVGLLTKNWKYHVAPVLPVLSNGQVIYYVLDPATANTLQPIDEWAAAITHLPHSYHFMRQAHWYIFPHKNIATAKWNMRNRQNRKWMIQSLAGINGLTPAGKARLVFNKPLLKKTLLLFEEAKKQNPLPALRAMQSR
ncbi:MAG: hypothetical protein H7Y86_00860 [Rhizobacter sp.]|nr:hypothetical protein [Ferruginibacter sp.]